jgi:antitoxin ChpS
VGNHAKKLAGRAFECLVVDQMPENKPRYTLDQLLAKCDASQQLPPEDREWIDAPSVGRELP